jgi:polyhydroxyalkanoate synthesis regulator phasin
MAQTDALKRYIDAGLAYTALTQSRAEALVRDLVKAGEVQADQARDVVVELIERSRRNSERLLEVVREEVRAQVASLGLVSRGDLEGLERRFSSLLANAPGPARAATAMATKAKATAARAGRTRGATTEPTTEPAGSAAKKATKKKATKKKATKKKATKKTTKKTATKKKATTKKAAKQPGAEKA